MNKLLELYGSRISKTESTAADKASTAWECQWENAQWECPVKKPAEEAVWEAAALAEYAGGQWNSDTLNIRRGLLAAIDDERQQSPECLQRASDSIRY